MEASYREMQGQALTNVGDLEDNFGIGIGIMIFRVREDSSLSRTRRELEGKIFAQYFPVEVPIYVIEYEE